MKLEPVTVEILCRMNVCVENKERIGQEHANNQVYA